MSGHNKWSTIKHRKGAQDKKRGKIFTKIIKEITVAAKLGGGDPDSNPRLRSALLLARANNMPNDNVKNAIKKAEGNADGDNFENIVYEGYGPHNVAVIVECLTDNRNRTISNVRNVFTKNNGNIGSTNSVMYMFDHIGLIQVPKEAIDEEKLTEFAIEAGAEDIDSSGDEFFEIRTDMKELHAVTSFLEDKKVEVNQSQLNYLPQTNTEISDINQAQQVLKFIDALEDDDDVQNVYSNFDISEDVLAELENS